MRKLVGVLLALTVLEAGSASAQRFTASLRGTVTATTGEPIPGASVTVRNVDTGLERQTLSNAVGNYSFGDLPVGTYVIQVELEGFRSAEVTDVGLNVADVRAVNFQLEVGEFADVVTVSSQALQVETIGGEVAGLITGEQIRELPLNGRNFVQLAQLMPGVSSPEGFNTTNKGLLAGVDLSISGGAVTNNLWTVDGANNNDTGSNRTILIYPSIDAIEEFKIHRNSYGAEFGGASGAQINLVTRSGSNELRGNVFYFRRDDSWNEKNFFLEQAGQDKEALSRDDVGFTLGGPIVKDRLHFFVSGEWNDEERGVVRTGFVPTAAERAGDFSGAGIPGCSSAAPIDPLTGQAFPGNVIPGNRLSPGGVGLLNLYPLPNTTPVPGSCNNWVAAVNTPIEWQQSNARLDFTPTARTRLMVRYTRDDWENSAPNAGSANGLWGDDPFPVVDSSWDQPGESLVVQLNQTLGTDAVNTVTFSVSGNEISIARGGTNPELNNEINSNVPPVFPNSEKTGGADRSHPVFWGGAGYQPLWNIAPWENDLDIVVLKDDYQQVFGDHWLKAGVSYGQSTKKEFIGGASAFESPQFWGAAGLNGWGATTGNLLADFLLEDMTHGFSENSFEPTPELEWEDLELYLSDSWQATDRLAIDYGVRWSRFQWPRAKSDALASFSPDAFDPALGSDPCNGILQVPGTDPCGAAGFLGGAAGPGRSLVEDDEDNFAPRLGLAWDLFGAGRSVLRAGFGQFYQRDRVGIQLEFAGNPPFTSSQAGIRKLGDASEPCGGCFAFSAGVPRVGIDPDFETPYTLQYNVTWEQRLGPDSTIEVSYVANRGRHLTRRSDINQVGSGDRNGNGIPDRLEYARNPGDTGLLGSLRPFSAFGDAQILYWESDGESEYDGLQTQFIKRFGRGSQFQASYTWSRFKANDPLTDSGAGSFAGQITDRDNPELDWGYAGLHRDHVANASLILNLPTLENSGDLVRNVFGDWQVGAIAFYSTGQALTVTTGGIPGINGVSGTGFLGNQRPLRVPGVPCGGSGQQVINPEAYTLTGFQLGTVGSAERGDCEGPDFFQVDLSLYKNIRITDRVKAQFRFEVFNITNEDNFINTITTMNPTSATFDAPVGAATQITGFTLPLNFGQATAARDPRQVQLGFKLSF
ncbi:MAG TPA: carboxypeptidase regulatory-like domain-containing protein [Thermoanaerobaculia bacterium]|nr:carboxypeptidase regulatory-like domain-containing protein [Thermoanaerobaculia bacterium]